MRENHGRLRDADRVAHRVGRRVREVHEHADAVHLVHDLLAEFRETAMARVRVHRRVGPVGVVIVRERHVTHAEVVIGAERPERIFDRMTALRAQHAGDLARGLGGADVRSCRGERERVRVALDHAARDVDLLELRAREVLGRLARRVHGPEHGADAARAQARDVGLPRSRRVLPKVVSRDVARRVLVAADRPGQVVVAVHQDRLREDFLRVVERGIGLCAGRNRKHEDTGKDA
jgi:hypothetical protein